MPIDNDESSILLSLALRGTQTTTTNVINWGTNDDWNWMRMWKKCHRRSIKKICFWWRKTIKKRTMHNNNNKANNTIWMRKHKKIYSYAMLLLVLYFFFIAIELLHHPITMDLQTNKEMSKNLSIQENDLWVLCVCVCVGLLCTADAPFYNPSITDKTSDIFFSPFGTMGIELFGSKQFNDFSWK